MKWSLQKSSNTITSCSCSASSPLRRWRARMESTTVSVHLLLSLSTLALLASSNSTDSSRDKVTRESLSNNSYILTLHEFLPHVFNFSLVFPNATPSEFSDTNTEEEITVTEYSVRNNRFNFVPGNFLRGFSAGVGDISYNANTDNISNDRTTNNVGGLHRFDSFHKETLSVGSPNVNGRSQRVESVIVDEDSTYLRLTHKHSLEEHESTNLSEILFAEEDSDDVTNQYLSENNETNWFRVHHSEVENITSTFLVNITTSVTTGISKTVPYWQALLLVIVKLIVMGGIIVVAVMGNILVIVSISLNRKLRSLANHFLISLAVADIMVAVCAMSFNASVQVSGRWMFGAIICDLWNSFDVYFSTVSILHLCCISMDRYYAILKPLEYPIYMTRKVVFCMIACSWLLPAVISFVPIFLGWYATANHLENRALDPNSCPFEVNTTYALISSGLSFWFPCTVMLVMYFRIFQEARKQEAAIMSRTNSTCNMNKTKRGVANSIKLQRFLACFRTFRYRVERETPENIDANLQLHHLPALAEASIKSRGNIKSYSAQSRPSVTESVISMTRCSIGSSPCLCSLSDKETFHDASNTLPSDKSRRVSLPIHDQTKIMTPPGEHSVKPYNHQNHYDKINEIVEEHIQINDSSGRSGSLVLSPDSSQFSSNGGQNLVSPPASVCNRGRSYCGAKHIEHPEGSSRSARHAPMMKREHKAARTLGIIMGAFILCWLPFFTWYVASNICGEACATPDPVVTLLFWIGYFNSTLNPFIYAYFRADFREAFRKTLRKLKFPCFQTPSMY